jgi:hypothetical protein
VEAELFGRDWKNIEAELNEVRSAMSKANDPLVDRAAGPPGRPKEAAILKHIADALRDDPTESDSNEDVG